MAGPNNVNPMNNNIIDLNAGDARFAFMEIRANGAGMGGFDALGLWNPNRIMAGLMREAMAMVVYSGFDPEVVFQTVGRDKSALMLAFVLTTRGTGPLKDNKIEKYPEALKAIKTKWDDLQTPLEGELKITSSMICLTYALPVCIYMLDNAVLPPLARTVPTFGLPYSLHISGLGPYVIGGDYEKPYLLFLLRVSKLVNKVYNDQTKTTENRPDVWHKAIVGKYFKLSRQNPNINRINTGGIFNVNNGGQMVRAKLVNWGEVCPRHIPLLDLDQTELFDDDEMFNVVI